MIVALTIDNIHQHFSAKSANKQQQLIKQVEKLMELMALLKTSHFFDSLKNNAPATTAEQREKQRKNTIRVQNLQDAADALNRSINHFLEQNRRKYLLHCIPYNKLNDETIDFIESRVNVIYPSKAVVNLESTTQFQQFVDDGCHLEAVAIHRVATATLWQRRLGLLLCVIALLTLLLALGLMLASPTPSLIGLFGVFILGVVAIPGLFGIGAPTTETMNATTYGVDVPTEIPVPMILAPLVAPFMLLYYLRGYLESWTISPPLEQKARDLDYKVFTYHARLIKCRIALDLDGNDKQQTLLLAAADQAERIYHSGVSSMIESNYQSDVAKALDLLLAVQQLMQDDCKSADDSLTKTITLRESEASTSLIDITNRSRNPLLDKMCFWRSHQTRSSVAVAPLALDTSLPP